MDYRYPNEISGPTKGDTGYNILVDISYSGTGRIYISEENSLKIMESNPDSEPIYLEIAGIRVLQQEAHLYSTSSTFEGLRFDWNQNGRTFSLGVFSYTQEEAIKIVESMIRQAE